MQQHFVCQRMKKTYNHSTANLLRLQMHFTAKKTSLKFQKRNDKISIRTTNALMSNTFPREWLKNIAESFPQKFVS